MGDIVEQLRAQADPRRARGPLVPISRLCDEAADEIVRLRELRSALGFAVMTKQGEWTIALDFDTRHQRDDAMRAITDAFR